MILLGLTKKILFADFLASKTDFYFNQAANLSTLDAWFAAYLFAFQIYFDFSAYSEIALGIGRLFGLRLDVNFRTPYLSGNATEFWRRWHITLSSWIRDYIYIPLGGSRKGFALQCLFIIIAMTVSGFWHGAAWTFALWGLYHGLLSAAHKVYMRWQKKVKPSFINSPIYKGFAIFVFFHLTTLGWVLFRAKDIGDAGLLFGKMLSVSQLHYHPVYILYFGFILFLYLLHILEYHLINNRFWVIDRWEKVFPPYMRAAAYTVVVVTLIVFTKTDQNAFIYFQF